MAFEVMASRAYGGKDYKRVGLLYKQGLLWMSLLMIIFGFSTFFTKEIFMLMGQESKSAALVQSYVQMVFPGVFCLGFFGLRSFYFNSQYMYMAPMIIQLFTTILHFFWCLFLQDLEIEGIAIAMNITLITNLTLIELYTFIFDPRPHSYVPWSFEVIKGFKEYIHFTTPIALTTFLEEFSYEINSVIASFLHSDIILSVHVVLAHTGSLLYTLPEGFSAALNSYVGIALGEKKAYKAQRLTWMSIIGGIIIIFSFCGLLIIFRKPWALFFSDNEEVETLLISFLPLFCLNTLLDALQLMLGAAIKTIGKGKIALVMYFCSLYLFANPMSYVMVKFL